MLDVKNERSKITDETLKLLNTEHERTGLGPKAIFKYAKTMEFVPDTSTMTADSIRGWIRRSSTTAPKADVEAITRAYRSIVPIETLPDDARDDHLVLMTDCDGDAIAEFLSARPISVRRLMLRDPSAPPDLTENRLLRLSKRMDKTAKASHVRFLHRKIQHWLEKPHISKKIKF